MESIRAGGLLTFTSTYRNRSNAGPFEAGDTGRDAVITETVPAGTTFVPEASTAGWICLPDNDAGSTCTIPLGDLLAGAEGTVTFTVRVDDPLPEGADAIINTTTINATGGESFPFDNTARESTPIDRSGPDLSVQKTVLEPGVPPGGTARFILTYANDGSGTATNVEIIETAPPAPPSTPPPAQAAGCKSPAMADPAVSTASRSPNWPKGSSGISVVKGAPHRHLLCRCRTRNRWQHYAVSQ